MAAPNRRDRRRSIRRSPEGVILTNTSRTYIRLLVGPLAAAGLMAGAIPVLAGGPAALTSTDSSHGTAQTTMAKTLTGKARIIDGRHSHRHHLAPSVG